MQVCSNHNETWGSDCEVYQMRCWCDKGLDGCRGEKYKHVHIEYYGVCRDMPVSMNVSSLLGVGCEG